MKRSHGFTLIELLVVIAIIALLIGILVPALAAARRIADQLHNTTNVRNIASALNMYAQGNGERFPDGDVAARFTALVDPANGSLVTNGGLIARRESEPNHKVSTAIPLLGGATGDVNYSYALLDRNNPEWRCNTNSSAPLVSDRLIGAGSIWGPTVWRGCVAWGDNHAGYETSRTLATSMSGVSYPLDDLFVAATAAKDAMMYHTGD